MPRLGSWRQGAFVGAMSLTVMSLTVMSLTVMSLTVMLVTSGCSGEGDDDGDGGDGADTTPSPTPSGLQGVEIRFEAKVGDRPFACGQAYEGLGVTSSTFEPWDLRLFVHHVRLVTSAGLEVPVSLEQDGIWQTEDVALLDFEDKTGRCVDGTVQTNTTVKGTLDAGEYTGIRFGVGVPFELNHQDVTLASSPLNVTSMFWSWNFGYKFIKLDGVTTGMSGGMYVHVGSTDCETNARGVVTSCDHPNRPEIALSGFDPASQTVVLDLAALFADVDLDLNAEATAAICMSEPYDPDCGALFASLGLPFDDVTPSSQTAFRIE